MIKKQKRTVESESVDSSPPKKSKQITKTNPNLKTDKKQNKKLNKTAKFNSTDLAKAEPSNAEFNSKKAKPFNKFEKKGPSKGKPFTKSFQNKGDGKPVDWTDFKKKKKEVQTKRKEGKTLYDVVIKAKKIGEILRRKTLEGGIQERNKLCKELHEMLKGEGNYVKLVMTHDMARIIQYMLKFSPEDVRKEIAKDMTTDVVLMLRSKYAKYCVKRMLKYGDPETRSGIVAACYGNAVKLASHSVSAAIFDYAYSTWASPLQKKHLLQEFFGDMYKQSKDDKVEHLRDVYTESIDMKTAALGATKANLQRILNKTLLDSHLVQTVFMQFLQECTADDRSELITQISPHIVVLSNSKEGARAAMICIWHGTNKDRKVCVKALKEHAVALAKHEHGHCTIITAMDALDDTKLVHKVLLTELITNALELAADEWGRKVLLWLVAPGTQTYFHPKFINELNAGRETSTCKKEVEIRRKELLTSVEDSLLQKVSEEPDKWISNSSMCVTTLAMLKAANGENLKTVFDALAKVITNNDFKIKEDGKKEMFGLEHTGVHMMLKKLLQHEKTAAVTRPQLGASITQLLTEEIVQKWIKLNRGCFLLVFILESDSTKVQNQLKELLKPLSKKILKLDTPGAKILAKKL